VIVLKGRREVLERVAFSPDGAAVAAPTWNGLQIWRPIVAGAEPAVLPVKQPGELHFTPDGNGLFVAGRRLNFVNLATGAVAAPVGDRSVSRFALAHAGDRYIVDEYRSNAHYMSAHSTGGILLWEHRVTGWWQQPFFLPGDEAFIRLTGGGGSARDERQYRIVTHATATGEELRRSAPFTGETWRWVLSPDATTFAVPVMTRVRIYRFRDPAVELVTTLRKDNRKDYTGVAFHPSGKYLAATSNDETVRLYDTTTWEVARTFTWAIGRMRSVCFSPDGTLAAAGSEKGQVVVWDVDL
jgi:WD40 repeat protein